MKRKIGPQKIVYQQTTGLDDKIEERKTEESKMYFRNHLAWEPGNREVPLKDTKM